MHQFSFGLWTIPYERERETFCWLWLALTPLSKCLWKVHFFCHNCGILHLPYSLTQPCNPPTPNMAIKAIALPIFPPLYIHCQIAYPLSSLANINGHFLWILWFCLANSSHCLVPHSLRLDRCMGVSPGEALLLNIFEKSYDFGISLLFIWIVIFFSCHKANGKGGFVCRMMLTTKKIENFCLHACLKNWQIIIIRSNKFTLADYWYNL